MLAGLFPGTPPVHGQSDKNVHTLEFVTSARPWNINQLGTDGKPPAFPKLNPVVRDEPILPFNAEIRREFNS
jgi:hypothetical protein